MTSPNGAGRKYKSRSIAQAQWPLNRLQTNDALLRETFSNCYHRLQ